MDGFRETNMETLMLVSTFERLCDVTLTQCIIPSFKPPKVDFVISTFLGCSECCSTLFSLVWICSPGYAWIVLKFENHVVLGTRRTLMEYKVTSVLWSILGLHPFFQPSWSSLVN